MQQNKNASSIIFFSILFLFFSENLFAIDFGSQGMAAFEREEYAKAGKLFSQAIELNQPSSVPKPLLYYHAAASYFNIGSYPQATTVLEDGILKFSKESNLHDLFSQVRVENTLKQAKSLEEIYEYDEAIGLYQDLVEGSSDDDLKQRAYLLYHLAYGHYLTGDLTTASQVIQQSLELTPENKEYVKFQDQLKISTKRPSGKKKNNIYQALKDVGSAGRLTGKNGILHIFVEGRNSLKWSQSKIQNTLQRIEQASEWLNMQALEKEISSLPTFSHQILIAPDIPLLRNSQIPQYHSKSNYVDSWLKTILASFKAKTFRNLFNSQLFPEDIKYRCIVIHVNKEGTSFALPLSKAHYESDLEVALVYFHIKKLASPFHPVVYAHELLHLYGADDLYDKMGDAAFSELELMHFGGYKLEKNYLSQLTDYAIGWSELSPTDSQLQIKLPYKLAEKKEIIK